MLGRATRLCPEIDKETFRIFDVLNFYDAMLDHTMKPVVSKSNFTQLINELKLNEDEQAIEHIRDQFLSKLHRIKKKIQMNHSQDFAIFAGMESKFIPTLKLDAQVKTQTDTLEKLAAWLDSLKSLFR